MNVSGWIHIRYTSLAIDYSSEIISLYEYVYIYILFTLDCYMLEYWYCLGFHFPVSICIYSAYFIPNISSESCLHSITSLPLPLPLLAPSRQFSLLWRGPKKLRLHPDLPIGPIWSDTGSRWRMYVAGDVYGVIIDYWSAEKISLFRCLLLCLFLFCFLSQYPSHSFQSFVC